MTRAELEAIEAAEGVRLGEGDILVFRTGHHARRLALGAWSNEYPPAGEGKAGLHVDTIPWMHERRIAAFLPDGDGETVPSNVEGMPYPIHPLQLTAMGMCISDSLQLEELATGLRAGGTLGVHGRGPAAAPAGRHGLALEPDRHLLSAPDRREDIMERRFVGQGRAGHRRHHRHRTGDRGAPGLRGRARRREPATDRRSERDAAAGQGGGRARPSR